MCKYVRGRVCKNAYVYVHAALTCLLVYVRESTLVCACAWVRLCVCVCVCVCVRACVRAMRMKTSDGAYISQARNEFYLESTFPMGRHSRNVSQFVKRQETPNQYFYTRVLRSSPLPREGPLLSITGSSPLRVRSKTESKAVSVVFLSTMTLCKSKQKQLIVLKLQYSQTIRPFMV